jgi:hypothetical protein
MLKMANVYWVLFLCDPCLNLTLGIWLLFTLHGWTKA